MASANTPRLLRAFEEAGGEEDDFEDPVDWDAIEENIENIMSGLKSRGLAEREAATAEAIALGVDPRLVLSSQLLNNSGFRRHSEKLPDLEKRAPALCGVPRAPEVAPDRRRPGLGGLRP